MAKQRPFHVPSTALYVESLDLEGHGVAKRQDGKVIFIEGALPGEWVEIAPIKSKKKFEYAQCLQRYTESVIRAKPACPYFGLHIGACGGCKLQHVDPVAQVAIKQRALEDQLWHIAQVKPQQLWRPIQGPFWGYRHRARLSLRYVLKKNELLMGFHERKSRYITYMHDCKILAPAFRALMEPLRKCIGQLEACASCPQIELAVGDQVIALVLRHLEPLSEDDKNQLRRFAQTYSTDQHEIQWWLQAKGPDSAYRLQESERDLAYRLDAFSMRMPYRPTDFTQINPSMNEAMVSQALMYLDVQPHERVIDWFCGLGNFTLPLATRSAEVMGVEGSASLLARAQKNAQLLAHQRQVHHLPALGEVQWVERNLFEMTVEQLIEDQGAEKWLIDPPREGALSLIQALVGAIQYQQDAALKTTEAASWKPPRRIIYVSCQPSTLARDAGILVHQAGYRCVRAGVMNMFAHTAHIESMAIFERP